MKYVIVGLAFAAIVTALGFAGMYMIRGGSGKVRAGNMARALAVRVGLSILLFVCILVSYEMGWIHPTGIPLT